MGAERHWAIDFSGHIWHTTDKGESWVEDGSDNIGSLRRIFFFDNGNVGYILGSNTLLKYDVVLNRGIL